MKSISSFLLPACICLIICAAEIQAQVAVKLQQPPPNQLRASDLWSLTLTNPTRNTYKIILSGKLTESSAGTVAEGESKQLSLPPGIKRITYDDVKSANVKFKSGKWQEAFTRTGNAPSGDYTICITVKNQGTGGELGSDCITQQVAITGPPQLTVPSDGSKIEGQALPTFTWLPSMPAQPGIAYKIKIVEILGNESPENAIRKNKAFFEKEGIRMAVFQYPSSAPKLIAGKRYAWTVSTGDASATPFSFIIIQDPSPGCFQIDTSKYKIVCNGVDASGHLKYKITDLILTNVGTQTGRTGLHNMAASNYITPTGFTIGNLTPPSATINAGNSINISFDINGATGTQAAFIVNASISSSANPSVYCDETIGVTVDLPECKCSECDSMNVAFNDFAASSTGGAGTGYNIAGSLSVNMPVYGFEIEIQSYSYSAAPSACSEGVTGLTESGMLLVPGTKINNSPVQMFNMIGTGTNNNAGKIVKYTSSAPLTGNIPVNLFVGLPGPLAGLDKNCCKIDYTVCVRVRVFYDKESCKSCTFSHCFQFSNQ